MKRELFLIVTLSFFINSFIFARDPISGDRYEALTGISKESSQKSGTIYNNNGDDEFLLSTNSFLRFISNSVYIFPNGASILDFSGDSGQIAVFLSRKGYIVESIRENDSMVEKIKYYAKKFGVQFKIRKSTKKEILDLNMNYDVVIYSGSDTRDYDRSYLNMLGNKNKGIFIWFYEYPKHFQNIDLKSNIILRPFLRENLLKIELPDNSNDNHFSLIIKKRS